MQLCLDLSRFYADPRFLGIHLIPESDNPEDDKLFLFFKENAMDGEHTGKATISRIGQLCKVTTLSEACVVVFLCFFYVNIEGKHFFFFPSASAERHGRPQESGEQVDHFPEGPPPLLRPRGQWHRHTL